MKKALKIGAIVVGAALACYCAAVVLLAFICPAYGDSIID